MFFFLVLYSASVDKFLIIYLPTLVQITYILYSLIKSNMHACMHASIPSIEIYPEHAGFKCFIVLYLFIVSQLSM